MAARQETNETTHPKGGEEVTKPTGYWCPMCGDLPDVTNPFPWIEGKAWHHGACDFKAIPVCTPLDVPEPTTWGESGGEEAVCWTLPNKASTGVYVCQSMDVRDDVISVVLSQVNQ